MITQLQYNGLTMGELDTGYVFSSLTGFDMPSVRVDVKPRGSFEGARLGMYNYSYRVMRVEGMIYANGKADYETKRRAMQQAFTVTGGLKTLTIVTRGGSTYEVDCMVQSALSQDYKSGQMAHGTFRLELVAPFPYIYSNTEETIEISTFSGGGGEIVMSIPFSLGNGGTGLQTITNNGTSTIYPELIFYGDIESPSLQNQTTGETINVNYDLPSASDFVRINTYDRTALYNDSTNIAGSISGTWITLQPGDNQLSLSGTGAAPSAKVAVIYKDSYLGI